MDEIKSFFRNVFRAQIPNEKDDEKNFVVDGNSNDDRNRSSKFQIKGSLCNVVFPPRETIFEQKTSNPPLESENDKNINFYVRVMESEEKIDLDSVLDQMKRQGCPMFLRPYVWPLVLGCFPLWNYLHDSTLKRYKENYLELLNSVHALKCNEEFLDEVIQFMRSVLRNVVFHIPAFRYNKIAACLERMLYVLLLDFLDNEQIIPVISNILARVAMTNLYALLYKYGDPLLLSVDKDLDEDQMLELETIAYNCTYEIMNRIVSGLKDIKYLTDLFRSYLEVCNSDLMKKFDQMKINLVTFVLPWTSSLLVDQIKKLPLVLHLWDRYLTGDFVECHLKVCVLVLNASSSLIENTSDPVQVLDILQSEDILDWDYPLLDAIIGDLKKYFP